MRALQCSLLAVLIYEIDEFREERFEGGVTKGVNLYHFC